MGTTNMGTTNMGSVATTNYNVTAIAGGLETVPKVPTTQLVSFSDKSAKSLEGISGVDESSWLSISSKTWNDIIWIIGCIFFIILILYLRCKFVETYDKDDEHDIV